MPFYPLDKIEKIFTQDRLPCALLPGNEWHSRLGKKKLIENAERSGIMLPMLKQQVTGNAMQCSRESRKHHVGWLCFFTYSMTRNDQKEAHNINNKAHRGK